MSVTGRPSMNRARCFSTMKAPISPAVVTAKGDRAVVCLDLDDQRSKHVDPKGLAALPVLGIARHRRGDVIINPVTFGLVVIVSPSTPNGVGADLFDLGHRHGTSPGKTVR